MALLPFFVAVLVLIYAHGWIKKLGLPPPKGCWLPLGPFLGGLVGTLLGLMLTVSDGGLNLEVLLFGILGIVAGLAAWALGLLAWSVVHWLSQRRRLRGIATSGLEGLSQIRGFSQIGGFSRAEFPDEPAMLQALEDLEESLDVRFLPVAPVPRHRARILESLSEREVDDTGKTFVMIPHQGWIRRRPLGDSMRLEPRNPFACVLVQLDARRITTLSRHEFGARVLAALRSTG